MNYYMVYPDKTNVRWTLARKDFYDSGNRIPNRAFSQHTYYESEQPVPFFIHGEGERMDYNPTALTTPVVSGSLATLIEEFASKDIQLIDATIDDEPGVWKVINFLSTVDCIDRTRSKIRHYPLNVPKHPVQLMTVVDRLVIDESRAQGHHFFLMQDWEREIVSETMRNAIEKAGITGMTYGHRPVNSP